MSIGLEKANCSGAIVFDVVVYSWTDMVIF